MDSLIQSGKVHRINIRLSGFDLKRLDKQVCAQGKRRSAIIRQALKEYYERQENPPIVVAPARIIRREVSND